jgi:hypothetical protein
MRPRPGIKFTINIPIPQSLADARDWASYQWRKTLFKLRPYRCDCCGVKVFVKSPQYEYQQEGRMRLLVENSVWNKNICRACLVNELETKEWTPRFTQMWLEKETYTRRRKYQFWSGKKCAVTGSNVRSYKDVEIYPHVDMTFCTIAWNHDYVSKQAVIDAVKYGDVKTSRWGVWNKQKMAPMNEKGLFINKNGELL